MSALVSLSGGMDSVTLLYRAHADHKGEVEALSFTYGSKHNEHESKAAQAICERLGVKRHFIDLTSVMANFKSNLLKSGGEIPEGHYQQSNMNLTVVPGRNLLFISAAMGLAWSLGHQDIYIGAHSGDHVIYPDCRPDFISSMAASVFYGSDEKVRLQCPYLFGDKKTILEDGFRLGVPYELTRTCYKDQPIACGRCGACQERLEAFAFHGVEDPAEYEFRGILPKSE